MSSIDLVILGMVLERPQSAYDIQKDVEYHNFARWTRISVPSVYKKVLRLREQGYLESSTVRGERNAEKTVYSVTAAGRAYFEELMERLAGQEVPLTFDFNVVVTNLSKLEKPHALALAARLRRSVAASAERSAQYAREYPELPLSGRAIFEQQRLLYAALLDWLDEFTARFAAEGQGEPCSEAP